MKEDFLIIPAMDIYNNQVVRLYQGNYEKAKVYATDPLEVLAYFQKFPLQRLHVVDLNAAREGAPEVNKNTIKKLIDNKDNLQIQLGGGIRSEETVRYYFDLGIDFLILGTVAIRNPRIVDTILESYDSKKFLISVDVIGEEVHISGWVENARISIGEFFQRIQNWGIEQIVLTDITRDGTLQGPNLKLIEKLEETSLRAILSGGIGSLDDIRLIRSLKTSKVIGVIFGKALYEGKIRLEDVFT